MGIICPRIKMSVGDEVFQAIVANDLEYAPRPNGWTLCTLASVTVGIPYVPDFVGYSIDNCDLRRDDLSGTFPFIDEDVFHDELTKPSFAMTMDELYEMIMDIDENLRYLQRQCDRWNERECCCDKTITFECAVVIENKEGLPNPNQLTLFSYA
jgi:hypothetical protein